MSFNFVKSIFIFFSLVFILGCATSKEITQKKQPNIIYILADDLGYGDLSCYNKQSKITTPNLDKLAAKGVQFTDAHTSSSVCTPTRYGILTGRYNWRSVKKQGVLGGYSTALIPQSRTTIASFLKKNGYQTAGIGKWHLGWDWANIEAGNTNVDFSKPVKNGPTTLGFDYFYGFCGSLDMAPYVWIENDMPTMVPSKKTVNKGKQVWWREGLTSDDFEHEQVLPDIAKKTVSYINEHAKDDKPFFVYMPLPAPHTPILPTEEFKGKSGLDNIYGDFVIMVDWVVGEVTKSLEEQGIADNTMIVFTSDNGCSPQADYKQLETKGHDPSHVFRGHKADIFEGGHRVPYIVSWPAKVKTAQSNQLLCTTDFFASVADMLNLNIEDHEAEDSYSYLNALGLSSNKSKRESIIHHSINGSFAYRKGDWKVNFCKGSGGWSYPRPGKNKKELAFFPPVQLYNLSKDIAEEKNLYKQHPDIVESYQKELLEIIDKGRSTAGERQQNDPAEKWTQLDKLRKPINFEEKLPPVIAPFSKLDTIAVNDWWNRKPNKIIDVKVKREDVIAFGIYTLSNKVLKLSAQLFPLYPDETREVRLEIKKDGQWQEIQKQQVNDLGWSALFKIENWEDDKNITYRLQHGEKATFEGIIRKNPSNKKEIVMAALSCNSNKDRGGRPNYVRNINHQDPDVVFFAGDQSYDHKEHTAAWLKFGMQFRDVFRNRPCVTIPDDHDIGQGNIWGEYGKKASSPAGNDGGYFYHPEYVKMVERCQTAHLPDPFDPTKIKQGIGVYYTNMIIGGVDFAIIEDRKFKSGPKGKIPQIGPRPDHIRDPNYDPSSVDKPGLELLGKRQLDFLEEWGRGDQHLMKAVLSQTGFCGAAHLHGRKQNRLHADMDSNGWPQTARNNALKAIEAANAVHIAGDQHLATVLQHGISEYEDGPWAFVVPAIVNNYYSRWWWPENEKAGAKSNGILPWNGRYMDGFNNKITMHAYANPDTPSNGAGYGLIRFNTNNKEVTFECWPRYEDVQKSDAAQFKGWPITIKVD